MANSFNNPIVITTAEGTLALPIFQTSKPMAIKRVVWLSPANIGDRLIVKDGFGNVIVDATAEVAGQSQTFLIEHTYDGLFVQQISSGTAYIHLN